MKTLRRRVIIRERDFDQKLAPVARKLYDRVTWHAITMRDLEQENILAILREPDKQPPWDLSNPLQQMFWRQNKWLYNPNYTNWVFQDLMGFVWIDPGRSNSRPSRMGWATVEKDIGVG